jgi:outer membrane protein W
MIRRITFTLLLFVMSLPLFAQAGSTEVGGSLVFPTFDEVTLEDEEEPVDVTLDVEGNMGFEASVNHFWTDQFSTEFSVTSMTADASIDSGALSVDVGEFDFLVTSAIAQWHFGRGGRFDPYVGGGLGYITGTFEINDPELEDEDVDLESEATFVAQAGLSFRMTDRVVLGGSVRYFPYEARAEDDETDDTLDLNPMLVSAYVRFRF